MTTVYFSLATTSNGLPADHSKSACSYGSRVELKGATADEEQST